MLFSVIKFTSIIWIYIGTIALSQNIRVDTFHLGENYRFKNFNFPIIRTGDKIVDSLINTDLKKVIIGNKNSNQILDSALINWIGEQIIFLDFETTYNQKGILSISISAEGCGAYCTSWTNYFNYSTFSGKRLNIEDVINLSEKFRNKVLKDFEIQYDRQKNELENMFKNLDSELDKSSYEWALEYYQKCENSFSLNTFEVYPNHIRIIMDCYFPNAIKNLKPIFNMKYSYSEIKEISK